MPYDGLDVLPRNTFLSPPAIGGLDVDFTQLIFFTIAGGTAWRAPPARSETTYATSSEH